MSIHCVRAKLPVVYFQVGIDATLYVYRKNHFNSFSVKPGDLFNKSMVKQSWCVDGTAVDAELREVTKIMLHLLGVTQRNCGGMVTFCE